MNDPTYKAEPSYDLIDALKLVPLFYTVRWTPAKKAEWDRITGTSEATTKVLCDHVRSAIEVHQKRPFEDHKGVAGQIVEGAKSVLGIDIGDENAEVLRDRIAEELQDAFDLGCKAAGGTILSADQPGLVGVALNREEIDVIMALLSLGPNETPTKASIREKIEFHATRKTP